MKFNEKYPELRKPPTLMGPNKDVDVTPELSQTWRLFPCFICKEVTGWRLILDNTPSNICSEECEAEDRRINEEIQTEKFQNAPDVVEAYTLWLIQ